jgi:hypothetical protein
VNDAICLVLTPLVLELTLALGRRPVPYLLTECCTAANWRSVPGAAVTDWSENALVLADNIKQIVVSRWHLLTRADR